MNTINAVLRQFKKIKIKADFSLLSADVKKALPYLKKAMDGITAIFLKQQDEKLPEMFEAAMNGEDKEKREYFELFKGPYNSLLDFASDYQEYGVRSSGCAFYPEDLTEAELDAAITSLGGKEKDLARDTYSVVRKQGDSLFAVPYHQYYREQLLEISEELKKAADVIEDPALAEYLTGRADSLLNGKYRPSDADWVRLTESALDLVIGPYEVYADKVFGLKATYESMLMIVDFQKGAELKEIEQNLNNLSAVFPLPAGAKAAVGGMAPIVVVQQIYAAGEADQGVRAAAFNLPNDPVVRGEVGWKQVMLHNIMEAKFEAISREIAVRVIADGKHVAFDPFFTFVLLHEVSHGLGPAYRADGSEVAKSLGKAYTAIEEAKADSGALFLLLKCGGTWGIPEYKRDVLLKTYLTGLFRSMRFGLHEAHGASNVMQFNWLREYGIIDVDTEGKFVIAVDAVLEVIGSFLEAVCTLEASATPQEADQFLKRYGKADSLLEETIGTLADLPTDIKPVFPDLTTL